MSMDKGIDHLLGVYGQERFMAEVYEKHWKLFVQACERPEDILSIEDVESYLFSAMPWTIVEPWGGSGLLAAKAPDGGRRAEITSAEEALSLYASGQTLILPRAQRRWPKLAELCARISSDMLCQVEANIYLTPPNSQGFLAHYDSHDVFLLQMEGSKRWRLRVDPAIQLPPVEDALRTEFVEVDRAYEGDEIEEVMLEKGASLYIPRGVVHSGVAEEQCSMHITFGLHPTTWYKLIRATVLDGMTQDISLRQSVPHEILCNLDAPESREKVLAMAKIALDKGRVENSLRFLYERSGALAPGGRIRAINHMSKIDNGTRLRLQPGADLFWNDAGHQAWFTLTGRRINVPSSKMLVLVDRVAELGVFSPNDLAELAKPEEALEFCRWLISLGVVSFQEG